ncbi:phage exclusion protein Lit family protein [Bradyrhizobium sp. B039]|uniref:phage exclusion protein Lit family protein n=1 Tax=Bradyrhizobium sp. B039 TaxID=3140239 RepID=UPI003182D56D
MNFLEGLFKCFEPEILAAYARAANDAGIDPTSVPLVFADKSWRLGVHEAEYAALMPPGCVQVTWNGITSLWACAQGISRLSRRMFDAQRAGTSKLFVAQDEELERGLYFYELSRRLAKHKFDHWVDWVPSPTCEPTNEDDEAGNFLFLQALGWILRHELAHLNLDHHARLKAKSISRYNAEVEADEAATRWAKGNHVADRSRPSGQALSTEELELERRAVSAGVGLLWVGMFEESFRAPSPEYPAVAERLQKSFDLFELPTDSFAAEIFSYSIKAWIDPEGAWDVPTDETTATAQSALATAVVNLHRHMNNL